MSSSPTDPCPDHPANENDLDFEPQRMVRWFRPRELIRTGTEALLSSVFGSYADWREVQALRAEHEDAETSGNTSRARPLQGAPSESGVWFDMSDAESMWIDYTADLGDGFNSTYTVARLLAERHLPVGGYETERGRLLVFGGDQVYPAASRTEYWNRMVGPYRAALPCVTDEEPPSLFAVPGNHDWYDGLTSFLRLFTQRRWIGGWKTRQRRSYFAIKLPHDWWLWGIDVQLDSDIDAPQLQYFRAVASSDVMPAGSKVILCSPEPAWVYAETDGPEAYHNLGYFRDSVLTEHGHELAVGLSGDLHTYARYEEADGSAQRFVAGGGGAYLSPTHDLPEELVPETPDGDRTRYRLGRGRNGGTKESVFPSWETSRRLAHGALLFPFKNWRFGLLMAALYLLFAWLLESASVVAAFGRGEDEGGHSLLEHLADTQGLWEAYGASLSVLQHTPSAVVLVIALGGGLYAFADSDSGWVKLGTGVPHAIGHVTVAILLMWGLARLNWELLDLGAYPLGATALFGGEMLLLGGVAGGFLFGLYLWVLNWARGAHGNEAFTCQRIPDYKNFLRLHVTDEGAVTIYPMGIEKVEKEWTLRSDAAREEPWFEGERDLLERVELIEPPISV